MPTGYTAEVANGTVADFRTFALRCARQFGATIMQCDDPMNDPPKHREVSQYAIDRVAKANARAAELAAMTVEEAEARANAEYEKAVADRRKYAEERIATRNRYNAMLADVMAWTPPTPDHAPMKQFMIDQLTESRKFDCTEYASEAPSRVSGAVWLRRAIADAQEECDRAAVYLGEERERCAKANAWIDALYASFDSSPSLR